MDWKMHMMVPLFFFIAVILVFQFQLIFALQALSLLIFSSFLPDLDHPKSHVRKATFIIIFYLMIFAITLEISINIWIKFLIITIMLVLTNYFYKHLPLKHRGKRSFHLWRYVFVFPTIFAFLLVAAGVSVSLVAFIVAGLGMHLGLDKIGKF
jgi:hypothetical protein